MYIKQIIIQGFKSYKEQTVIEPFSPKTNVIVGRNGSGKSNFFAAIRFVLSDAYSSMGREERQALLHEGSGSAVTSAYVEVIFDNSDERFPTGKDELILRRTIGLKKDDYSLDRKNATKADVNNLLESAGFSRSNPYYIVPQGRVTALTNMKDAERLTILKEVAGTQVYEARRAESLKIMTETDNKRTKIDESLEYIKERLSELEEEKEELRGYQEKDKELRCLKYAFFAREQTALSNAIEEIEDFRQMGDEGTEEDLQAFADGENAVAAFETEIEQLQRHVELLKLEKLQMEDERKENAKKKAKTELLVKSLTDNLSSTEHARTHHQQQLKDVKQEIASKEAELAEILPEFTKRKSKEADLKMELDAAEGSRRRLFEKQGRSAQFKSKAERDEWLKKEIQELNTTLGGQKANRINADEEVKNTQSEIKSLEGEIAGLRKRFDGWGGSRQALQDEVSTAKDALEKLSDDRKQLRRDDDRLESHISEARQEQARTEKDLSHTMDGKTARGLATVRRLKRENNIQGAYGTLAELLEVPEAYRQAAEQTAGNSLFHYIVDNAETAKQLSNALYDKQGGRVTFMPLDQLRVRPVQLPNAQDAVPILNKIKFDKKYSRAFEQVFGKTVICPNLTIAGQYSRSHGCNAITPDGDTQNKKGAMTGGYIDPRKSRLLYVQAVNKSRGEYDSLRDRALGYRRDIEVKDQEITAAHGRIQKLEQKLRQLDDGYDPLRHELKVKNSLVEKAKYQLENNTKRREVIENLLKDYGDTLAGFESELTTDFKKNLTAQEEEQLEKLGNAVLELQKEWNELSKGRRELESRMQMLEVELRESLRLKLDNLNSQAIDPTTSNSSGNLKEAQRDLKRITKQVADVASKLEDTESKIEEATVKLGSVASNKAKREAQNEEFAKDIEKQKRKMEKSLQKKALLQQSAQDNAKQIRDLGVLPEEAFTRFVNTASDKIQLRMKKVEEALKKFPNVNKKAFEQYNNFTSQRDGLLKRRKELDGSQASIQELVEVLDQRKDEAIERTFKQVSKAFASVFERLVPAGRGRLVIQRKTDQRVQEDGDSDDEPRKTVENYTGVGISVSFNSQHDEQQRIQQLSGGQKSLCALALVFAIQQSDPAPFYLFDEIDANLDAQYRTAVAQMLEEIATQQSGVDREAGQEESGGMSGQFICTTFRPEMLHVAAKCYGVTFHNKTSKIDTVSRKEALQFVDGEAPK
ncbi:putative chromosome segregation protein sudA [Calycina marina]|uniref:Structural maintenance of chromosomes protein n=1 Tax=Calycina marina TaxID=1763456 RepID=A0A9P7Z7D5_9HELO|nr:putative chromosome segregation protein sudA [Calycina marina]